MSDAPVRLASSNGYVRYLATYATYRAALRRIEPAVKRLEEGTKYLSAETEQRSLEAEQARLLTWLRYDSIDFEGVHEDVLGYRQSGTGAWFFEEPKFNRWLSEDNGLLWIYGIRK